MSGEKKAKLFSSKFQSYLLQSVYHSEQVALDECSSPGSMLASVQSLLGASLLHSTRSSYPSKASKPLPSPIQSGVEKSHASTIQADM